jgi:nitrite reductase/ring-hydroxylating ferredoxin subunit
MAKGFDRRRFICGGCALTLAACAPPPPGPLDTAGTTTGDTDTTTTSSITGYPCDQTIDAGGAGWTALPLSEYPDLADVGGWYPVTVGGNQIIVAHAVEGCYSAIVRACAHEGALINYVPARQQYVCPRHGAVYDLAGDKVSGPQPRGLQHFPCGREGDTVWVRA